MWPPSLVDVGLAAGAIITLITILMSCVCGCKNNNPKSELVGTAGVVTLHGEEDIPSLEHTTPESIKRASGQNSQRSLPEIPHIVVRHNSGDTASDIYATVGLDQDIAVGVSAPPHRTDHPYEHAYTKLHDEFKLFTAGESNPPTVSSRASLFAAGPSLESRVDVSEAVPISACVAISGQLPSSQELPYITPQTPSPHLPAVIPVSAPHVSAPRVVPEPNYFSGDSTDSTKGYTSISVREPLSQIRVAGSQLSRDDTSPASTTRQHYTTVSDDSDEMYAAIDEPVQDVLGLGSDVYAGDSETYAQIQPLAQQKQPHTAVNVDTDRRSQAESAAEDDTPARLHTSHHREASISSTTNMASALGSPKPEKRQANSPLPPPPPTSHLSDTVHTSLASSQHNDKSDDSPQQNTSSSLVTRQQRISSTGDLNAGSDRSRRSLNEKHERNNSCVSSSDFYGCNYHVDSQRFSSGDVAPSSSRPLVAKALDFSFDSSSSTDDAHLHNSIEKPGEAHLTKNDSSLSENSQGDSFPRDVEGMYAKVVKKGRALNSTPDRDRTDNKDRCIQPIDSSDSKWNEDSSHNSSPTDSSLGVSTKSHVERKNSSTKNEDPGYETIDQKINRSTSYKTVIKNNKTVTPSGPQDPGYETVGDSNGCDDIARALHPHKILQKLNHIDEFIVSGPDSILGSDPGYEQIRRDEILQLDSDPNYEVLRPQPPTPPYASIASASAHYSVVNKKPNQYQNNTEPYDLESNYESMPHELLYATSSESDSNYESVKLKDPNYESVKYFRSLVNDPPYERVHNNAVNKMDISDSSAGYDNCHPVNKPDAINNNSPVTTTDSAVENTKDDYFQV